MLRNVQGIQAPLKIKMELLAFSKVRILRFLYPKINLYQFIYLWPLYPKTKFILNINLNQLKCSAIKYYFLYLQLNIYIC